MENKIQELAKALKDNWIWNYTLSGSAQFKKCEAQKWAILDEAEALGIRSEVYALAVKVMNGEA